jgi:DinB superfamily
MVTTNEVLVDVFTRVADGVAELLRSVDAAALSTRPDGAGNSVAWLVWHLTRVQDDHLAEVADREQVWTGDGWYERLALPFPAEATGYGFNDAQVDATAITDPALLAGYHAAVHAMTVDLLSGISAARLDEIIDERWDPPVTVVVRIVSAEDCFQHLGQANYVGGLLQRR